MISLYPWRADLKRARAACVLGILLNQEGYYRPTALFCSSFIQQVCRGAFWIFFFVKNNMALSSVGLYSAIQMEVKAATVQWLRSTPKFQRFQAFAPMLKTKHPTHQDAGAGAGLIWNKRSKWIPKVTKADCTLSGQDWKLKVCRRKIQLSCSAFTFKAHFQTSR